MDTPIPLSKAVEELEYQLSAYKDATQARVEELERIDRLLLGVAGRTREERIQTLLEWQRIGRAATGAAGLRDATALEGWCRDRRATMEQIPIFGKRQ